MGRPKNREPSRSSAPSLRSFKKKPTHHITACAHDGCPCMEHGRHSDTIKNVATTQLQEDAATENWGISMRCPMARGIFGA